MRPCVRGVSVSQPLPERGWKAGSERGRDRGAGQRPRGAPFVVGEGCRAPRKRACAVGGRVPGDGGGGLVACPAWSGFVRRLDSWRPVRRRTGALRRTGLRGDTARQVRGVRRTAVLGFLQPPGRLDAGRRGGHGGTAEAFRTGSRRVDPLAAAPSRRRGDGDLLERAGQDWPRTETAEASGTLTTEMAVGAVSSGRQACAM